MNVKKLKIAWKNKWKILEGIWNNWFPNVYLDRVATRRAEICRSNICGYYDPKGVSEDCFLKGKSCCSSCGCSLQWKLYSLSSECGIKTKEPDSDLFWKAEMTEREEEKFRNKTNIKNE